MRLSWSRANRWCTAPARRLALDIAGIAGLDCGPSVVGWIAAVWNLHVRGRRYDYAGRLADKALFPDGPRGFDGNVLDAPLFGAPWRTSLAKLLERETLGELSLAPANIVRLGALHAELDQHDMPIIIRMYPDRPGLHYVTLYQSARKANGHRIDELRFYWQDTSRYSRNYNGRNPGLGKSGWHTSGGVDGTFSARRVVMAGSAAAAIARPARPAWPEPARCWTA